MKIVATVKIFSLITILFISQISNAFVYSSFDFASQSGHPCSNEVMAHMHNTQSEILPQHNMPHNMTSVMDCCDMSATPCCGSECQCVTVSATSVYMPVDTSETSDNQSGLSLLAKTPDTIHPLPSLLIRPPISIQS